MPFYTVGGVKLHFPHQPYDVQLDYMEKVVEALSRGENGLLESPTGTGKTLSLLCGVLGWLAEAKKTTPGERPPVSRVYYASRTHAQLKQAIREFRKTRYGKVQTGPNRITMTALGSRDQLCVHPRTDGSNSTARTKLCQELVKTRGCRWFIGTEDFLTKAGLIIDKKQRDAEDVTDQTLDAEALTKAAPPPAAAPTGGGCGGGCAPHSFPSQTHAPTVAKLDYSSTAAAPADADRPDCRSYAGDIEDLVAAGKAHGFCPFYYTRRVMSEVDVVFLPYAYLLDPTLRAQVKLDLDDAVVIIDEGHNIASVAMDASSYSLTSVNLAEAVAEIQRAAQRVGRDRDPGTGGGGASQNPAAKTDSGDLGEFRTLARVLRVMITYLEKQVAPFDALPPNSKDDKEVVTPGALALPLLEKEMGLTTASYQMMRDVIDRILEKVGADAAENGTKADTPGLQRLVEFLNGVFAADRASLASSYYLVVYREKQGLEKKYAKHNIAPPIVLGLWCMDASVGLRRLVAPKSAAHTGVRSLFITSGTLSPMEVFMQDLGLPFDVKLQNPHVIQPSQLMTVAVTHGGNGAALDSRWQNRSNADYIKGLGLALAALINAAPDGFLVFFQSFTFMREMLEAWKKPFSYNGVDPTSIHDVMFRRKMLVEEPTNAAQSAVKLREYRRLIDEGEGKGAALFGVFRGKMAEGTDFPDGYCRGVALVGIPYANRGDLKVRLRSKHVSNNWYTLDALRAINQAIGRVIRHPKDYGSVFLLDERFDSKGLQQLLPRWVGSQMRSVKAADAPDFLTELKRFYRDNDLSFGGHVVRATGIVTGIGRKTKRAEEEDEDELFAEANAAGGSGGDGGVITFEEMSRERKRARKADDATRTAQNAFRFAREYQELRHAQEPVFAKAGRAKMEAHLAERKQDEVQRRVGILTQEATLFHLGDFLANDAAPAASTGAPLGVVRDAQQQLSQTQGEGLSQLQTPAAGGVIEGLEGLPAVGPVIRQYTLPQYKAAVQRVLAAEQYDVWRRLLHEFAAACEAGGPTPSDFMQNRFVPWLVDTFTKKHADLLRSHVVTLPPMLRKEYLSLLKVQLKNAKRAHIPIA